MHLPQPFGSAAKGWRFGRLGLDTTNRKGVMLQSSPNSMNSFQEIANFIWSIADAGVQVLALLTHWQVGEE
jgi:hypothetical protein